MAASVLNGFRERFDTHLVEKRILREYPEAFAQELLRFAQSSADPLHQFSAHFAKWIDRQFGGQIRQTRKVLTPNLAGDSIQNQQWERVNGAPVS